MAKKVRGGCNIAKTIRGGCLIAKKGPWRLLDGQKSPQHRKNGVAHHRPEKKGSETSGEKDDQKCRLNPK